LHRTSAKRQDFAEMPPIVAFARIEKKKLKNQWLIDFGPVEWPGYPHRAADRRRAFLHGA
jgi:hypothetical protein